MCQKKIGKMKKLSIIKIGGQVLDEPAALENFLRDFSDLPEAKILVHGGGKIASEFGKRLGLEPKYIAGRRITDDATLELVTMVYGGLINRQICARLQSFGCNSIGLTGADGNLLPASRRPIQADGTDFGWAGDVETGAVNIDFLKKFLADGLIPVVAPLTHDRRGNLLNTNADTIAASLATALAPFFEIQLLFCFEKMGVLADPTDEKSVIPKISPTDYDFLKTKTAVAGGILPKLDNAFAASKSGVKKVVIGNAAALRTGFSGTEIGELVIGELEN